MTGLANNYANLSKRFEQHLSAIHTDIRPTVAQALWQDIAARYNEPIRAYHNLAHLQQLFGQFEQIKQYLNQLNIVALALYFHDVIYDPARPDNEQQSAEYATKILSPYLDKAQCQRVYQLIMLTADHQLDDANDTDAAFVLDMDLSILGAAWSDYKKYAQAIRQEYAHVAQADYQAGRTKVLAELLAHPRLYLTDYYFKRLETQARDNMKREVDLLLHN